MKAPQVLLDQLAEAEATRAGAELDIASLEAELKEKRAVRARAKAEATAYRKSIAGIEKIGQPKTERPATPSKRSKPDAPGTPDA